MFLRKLFDIRTVWGKILFWLIAILSSVALGALELYWALDALFGLGTEAEVYMGIYFVLNLLVNILLTRKKWSYLPLGVLIPLIATVIFWGVASIIKKLGGV